MHMTGGETSTRAQEVVISFASVGTKRVRLSLSRIVPRFHVVYRILLG